jgi:hypothetical protein
MVARYKRNVTRFSRDFAFRLTVEEAARLKVLDKSKKIDEHGALMAANVVRSARAVQ